MPLHIVLVELKNYETNQWEYIEDPNFEIPQFQHIIDSTHRICHCHLFECCGEGFYELFSEIEKIKIIQNFSKDFLLILQKLLDNGITLGFKKSN